jgi:hypothetical protein
MDTGGEKMKEKTRCVFNVNFTPKIVHDIGQVMSKLDLGITGCTMPIDEQVSFLTTTKVTTKYITAIIEKLQEAYESTGNVVHSVDFIKASTFKERK